LFNAIGLYLSRWRKKKVEQYIIPPTFYKINDYSIKENSNVNLNKNINVEISKSAEKIEFVSEPATQILKPTTNTLQPKVSAFSLSSIKAKKELQEANKSLIKDEIYLPNETFTETEMLIYWNKYAERLNDKGYKIMESLLQMNKPKLDGNTIVHELPNEGSKLDFETEKHELLQYLRSHLKNHDLTIRVDVNEVVSQKFAFTDQDKFDRLMKINPNLELLKKAFDLDF
jgi:DNA polymerase III subunit gamma/tau